LEEERGRTRGADEQIAIERRAADEMAGRVQALEEAVAEVALARDRAVRERQAMLDGQRDLVSELKNARDRSAELGLDLSARREAELGLRGRLEAFEADLTQRVQEHEALLRRYSELARERDGLREELLALDDREKSLRAEEQRLAARARAAESERDAA